MSAPDYSEFKYFSPSFTVTLTRAVYAEAINIGADPRPAYTLLAGKRVQVLAARFALGPDLPDQLLCTGSTPIFFRFLIPVEAVRRVEEPPKSDPGPGTCDESAETPAPDADGYASRLSSALVDEAGPTPLALLRLILERIPFDLSVVPWESPTTDDHAMAVSEMHNLCGLAHGLMEEEAGSAPEDPAPDDYALRSRANSLLQRDPGTPLEADLAKVLVAFSRRLTDQLGIEATPKFASTTLEFFASRPDELKEALEVFAAQARGELPVPQPSPSELADLKASAERLFSGAEASRDRARPARRRRCAKRGRMQWTDPDDALALVARAERTHRLEARSLGGEGLFEFAQRARRGLPEGYRLVSIAADGEEFEVLEACESCLTPRLDPSPDGEGEWTFDDDGNPICPVCSVTI